MESESSVLNENSIRTLFFFTEFFDNVLVNLSLDIQLMGTETQKPSVDQFVCSPSRLSLFLALSGCFVPWKHGRENLGCTAARY